MIPACCSLVKRNPVSRVHATRRNNSTAANVNLLSAFKLIPCREVAPRTVRFANLAIRGPENPNSLVIALSKSQVGTTLQCVNHQAWTDRPSFRFLFLLNDIGSQPFNLRHQLILLLTAHVVLNQCLLDILQKHIELLIGDIEPGVDFLQRPVERLAWTDRKSTRLN